MHLRATRTARIEKPDGSSVGEGHADTAGEDVNEAATAENSLAGPQTTEQSPYAPAIPL